MKEVLICTEFLGKVSLQMKKKLQQIFRECGKGLHLRIVFKSPNRLRNGFSFKDSLSVNMDSFLLYKYTCDTCNCVYIGETKRHFQVRAYEHLGVSIKTDNELSYNGNTATAVMCANTVTISVMRQALRTFRLLGMPVTSIIFF